MVHNLPIPHRDTTIGNGMSPCPLPIHPPRLSGGGFKGSFTLVVSVSQGHGLFLGLGFLAHTSRGLLALHIGNFLLHLHHLALAISLFHSLLPFGVKKATYISLPVSTLSPNPSRGQRLWNNLLSNTSSLLGASLTKSFIFQAERVSQSFSKCLARAICPLPIIVVSVASCSQKAVPP